jgi:DNA-binding transcriptional regulator YdaS (Cro superfamily)
MAETGLQKAIRAVGGGTELARLLGVSKSAVSQWGDSEDGVPLDRCVDIERETGVPCEELRPDMVEYFTHLRRTPNPEPKAA